MGHFQVTAQLIKQAELRLGCGLDVVVDELNEVGLDPLVGLVNHPPGDANVVEPGFGQVEVTRDHDDDRRTC